MAGIDVLTSAFSGNNAAYLADAYARWIADPASVDPSWRRMFETLGDEARAVLADAHGASWAPRSWDFTDPANPPPAPAPAPKTATPQPAQSRQAILDSIQALMLIRTYRVRGHLQAKLDPLGLQSRKQHPELDPAAHGFAPTDLDRPIFIAGVLGLQEATLRNILTILEESYCGPIGVEFMHIQDPEQKSWIQRKIEAAPWKTSLTDAERRALLQQVTEAEGFETFCQRRFVGTKRFGLEGGEATIPALHAIMSTAARAGVAEIAIGMAHRGRLNTLVNVVRKPFTAVFSEFGGASSKPEDVQGSGDVKYHLGTSSDIDIAGHRVHVSLQPNPSHLEAVDPVVAGKIRARQDMDKDRQRKRAMALLIHGDAAFAGQGVNYETLAMSQLIGYRVGGTVHIVINNQIGFTTVPAHAYSGLYCTDVAKSVQAPILHVNGEDLEAVVYCAKLCAEYRQAFAADIVLDIVCYRRHGHNENDEPAFTQPIMYRAIKQRQSVRALYAAHLAARGVIAPGEADDMMRQFHAQLEQASEAAQAYRPNKADWLEGRWSGLRRSIENDLVVDAETSVTPETLRKIGQAFPALPDNFVAHPKILRQMQIRHETVAAGAGIDWATAEALAFGSLLLEGHRVRLSGEDCQRGTFSQRHAVLIDQETQEEFVPLNHIAPDQQRIEIYNSLLSEVGVLGFEYGYSLADPQTLVLWEAQFGDFANGAQVVIDQFIASGESKWLRMSGLVMLLPHGYEGQGPEHSSARLERYLQLCAENNMIVANLTTPANYFHALRRQMKRSFRKPLILMTPKSLLRNKLATSALPDFTDGSTFRKIIPDETPADPAAVRRIVLCSGKIYYDLLAERSARAHTGTHLVRLEQIYPFPGSCLATLLGSYPNAELAWCQEEPENMGAWTFVDRRLETLLTTAGRTQRRAKYFGRIAAASPATGLSRAHAAEQAQILDAAFSFP